MLDIEESTSRSQYTRARQMLEQICKKENHPQTKGKNRTVGFNQVNKLILMKIPANNLL